MHRKILEALKLMKLDMVNFTIAQFRPYVQQHSVDYERKKFKSLLEIQKGAINLAALSPRVLS